MYKLERQADGSYASPTTVATFGATGNALRNTQFSPVTLDAAGNIFGAANDGGGSGIGGVYKIAAGTSTVTTLASFASYTGSTPRGSVVLGKNGTLWGTNMDGGGVGGGGAVYKVEPGMQPTVTAVFGRNGLAGYSPASGLIADAQGNLYGSTLFAATGSVGYGTLFKVDSVTGFVTTLATFAGGPGGGNPVSSLAVDDAGNLFGTAGTGGGKGYGTVFKLAAGASTITTLASFDAATSGTTVRGLIVDAVGNLFGTTASGSGNAYGGAVWKLAAGSSTLETLASFASTGTGPRQSYSGLVADAAGNLYGTSSFGGAKGFGTVFKLANTGYGIAPAPAVASDVPEPATWGTMLLGFGLVGGAMRLRRRSVIFSAA